VRPVFSINELRPLVIVFIKPLLIVSRRFANGFECCVVECFLEGCSAILNVAIVSFPVLQFSVGYWSKKLP
jgi:hypothetical protein